MNTLTKLTIKDFQSLADTELDLDSHYSCFIGPSNLGKSAALRALKALVNNAPSSGLVRHGAKEFRISAEFDDGTTETLTKSAKKSEFDLNGSKYPKAGAYDVPDDIAALWGVPNSSLNFAGQHDPPFLLAESASTVAKVLGDLTNASMLAAAVGEANKIRTRALADEKARTREAEEARTEILTHAGLNARGKAIESAKGALRAAQEAVQRWEQLTLLAQQHSVLLEEQTTLDISFPHSVEQLENLVQSVFIKTEHAQKMNKVAETYETLLRLDRECTQRIELCEIRIQEIQSEIHELLEKAGVCPMCGGVTV